MRNPRIVLYVSQWTAPAQARNLEKKFSKFLSLAGEEGGDDVKSAWPSDALGYTRVTMVLTMGCQAARRS